MEWSNRPKSRENKWLLMMVGELKLYQNPDMQEAFNTQKLFLQCWNHVSSTYTETENKFCKIMVIVHVFYVNSPPLSSLNPFMVSIFNDTDIPPKQTRQRRKDVGAFPCHFHPSKILIKNQEMCKES